MKKLLHFMVLFIGAFTMMVGTSSCKDKEECCEFTDDFGDFYRYCEDDLPAGYSWSEVQAYTQQYGGECD